MLNATEKSQPAFHVLKVTSQQTGVIIFLLYFSFSKSSQLDDSTLCTFGSYPEKTSRNQLITVTTGTRGGEHKEIEITEMDFRKHCAVACVNGEFIQSIFRTPPPQALLKFEKK